MSRSLFNSALVAALTSMATVGGKSSWFPGEFNPEPYGISVRKNPSSIKKGKRKNRAKVKAARKANRTRRKRSK